MVKYGKEFRKFQVEQWKAFYIDYKLLKQEIKTIKENIEQFKSYRASVQGINETRSEMQSIRPTKKLSQKLVNGLEVQDLNSLYNLPYGNELKRFINLVDKEFRKSYIFFVNQEKELYKRVNIHCYNNALNKDLIIINIFNQIKEISITMKLAKQLNCFINDNVMALKKILKKFDKKFSGYFGIITPKYISTHLTSQSSDLEYLLLFKLIDESTTVCEKNLSILLNMYKKLQGNNTNINIDTKNNNEKEGDINPNDNLTANNLKNIHENINNFKIRIYDYIDTIDELTYFKIQYREWFYYAKQNNRLVKNNPKLLENDIYNPILSSAYIEDSILEKCISSKSAFKEVELIQSALSTSNKRNLILICIQAFIYGTMLTNILPFITNYFDLCISRDNKVLFIIPFIATYVAYLFPFSLYIYIDFIDGENFYMKITYIISYIFLLLSSLLLFFVKNDQSYSVTNFLLITVSRILIGLANNQMMNKKYITLFVPKFRLSGICKKYLMAEIIGQIAGPFITFILFLINEFDILNIQYRSFNCIGWYNFFASIIFGLLHLIFFVQPKSGEFFMVEDENNINGNKYYRDSESQMTRKKYIKEQNQIYRKTYDTMKKLKSENLKKKAKNDENNENIKDDDIITTNNLEENLIDNNDIRISIESGSGNEENNSLEVSIGGNIALTAKQQNMINKIEKVLDQRNVESQFNDMNKIPATINTIMNKEKQSFGYVNQNILLLFVIFFINSFIKINRILYYIYFLEEKYYSKEQNLKEFSLLIFILGFFQFFRIFFIFPFYQVNYKFKTFMFISLTNLVLFNTLLVISENKIIFTIFNVFLLFGCNVIDICCACYLSFILSPEWKFFGKIAGRWVNYIITGGKILGGVVCLLIGPKGNANNWILVGISFSLLICIFYFVVFTRILKIKGITRVIRKSTLETNLNV